ncbi:hypothetical protein [Brevibacillus invocatus]|nr:hypothetical protein [Brevibacillus invocatus]
MTIWNHLLGKKQDACCDIKIEDVQSEESACCEESEQNNCCEKNEM